MPSSTLVHEILIWTLPVLFAVTVHEVAHGFVASFFGDKTALMLGRLTLNPLKHIDVVGTIVVPLACLSLGGFVFGWAKPVPVNWGNLRHPRRDMALVALAGPLANLLMALLWAIVAKAGTLFTGNTVLLQMGKAGVTINLVLMVLNLIPIPPLDGSRVVRSVLPANVATLYDKIEPYGFMILLALIFTQALSLIMGPPLMWLQKVISSIFGI